jgi:type II secretory pathway component PulF
MQYRMFWFDLAALLDLGLPLMRSLNIICQQLSNTDSFGCGIKKIIEDAQGGLTFSEALAASSMFSSTEICAIRAGEVGEMLCLAVNCIADGRIPSRADQYESFYQILSSLLACGVPILQALKESERGLDPPLREAVEKIHDSIRDGGTIVDAMTETGQFSFMEANLVDVSENRYSPSDSLDIPTVDICSDGCNLDFLLSRLAMLSRRPNNG